MSTIRVRIIALFCAVTLNCSFFYIMLPLLIDRYPPVGPSVLWSIIVIGQTNRVPVWARTCTHGVAYQRDGKTSPSPWRIFGKDQRIPRCIYLQAVKHVNLTSPPNPGLIIYVTANTHADGRMQVHTVPSTDIIFMRGWSKIYFAISVVTSDRKYEKSKILNFIWIWERPFHEIDW